MVDELRQLCVRKLVRLLFELPYVSHDCVFESDPMTLLVPVAQEKLAEVHEFLVWSVLELTILLDNEAKEGALFGLLWLLSDIHSLLIAIITKSSFHIFN